MAVVRAVKKEENIVDENLDFLGKMKVDIKYLAHSPKPGDEALLVKFDFGEREMRFLSQQEGRPVYEDVLMISVRAPGDRDPVFEGEATAGHRERFLPILEKFLNKQDTMIQGTSLDFLPGIRESQIRVCQEINIFTLEQLAGLADGNVKKLGMGGRELYERAKKYIDGTSELNALREENDNLKAEIESQKKEIKSLNSEIKTLKAKTGG